MANLEINNLLCFLTSAKNDYGMDTLSDIIYCFYAHEEIKAAKTLLCNILKKDIIWRRDPDKKRKDLQDVITYFKEIGESRNGVRFVANSHKCMPPMGMELLAPLITSMSEEIKKINEVLPKVMDIKSEVFNTADTVRQVRIDVIEMSNKFNKAVNGLQDATNQIRDEDEPFDGVRTFRHSLKLPTPLKDDAVGGDFVSNKFLEEDITSKLYASVLQLSPKRLNKDNQAFSSTPRAMVTRETGARTKEKSHIPDHRGKKQIQSSLKSNRRNSQQKQRDLQRVQSNDQEVIQVQWDERNSVGAAQSLPGETLREKNNNQHNNQKGLKNNNNPDEQSGQQKIIHSENLNGHKKRHSVGDQDDGWKTVHNKRKRSGGSRLVGARKDANQIRAVRRTADVFLGRLEVEVTRDDIKLYIKDIFNIEVLEVVQLSILSSQVKAFKITVNLDDRQTLFNPELWPQNVIVDKFYNRKQQEV